MGACSSKNNAGGSGMRVSEGGRQLISDSTMTGFMTCNNGSYGTQYANPYQNQYNNQYNNQYSNQYPNPYNNQYTNGYSNPYGYNTQNPNPYATGGGNGQIQINYQSTAQTATPANQQASNGQYGYGSQVSLVILRNSANTQQYPNTTQAPVTNGYSVAQLQVSGLQYPVSPSQCTVSAMSESASLISGTITCKGAYQNAPQVTLSFGCQPR